MVNLPKVKDRKWYHRMPCEAKDRKWYHGVPCKAKSCFQQRESSPRLAEVDSQARLTQAGSVSSELLRCDTFFTKIFFVNHNPPVRKNLYCNPGHGLRIHRYY